MTYKPGDPVWAIVSPDSSGLPPGKHAAIVTKMIGPEAYELDMECFPPPFPGALWFAWAWDLRPRRDDGVTPNARGNWSDCPFKPDKAWKRREPNIVTVTVTIPAPKVPVPDGVELRWPPWGHAYANCRCILTKVKGLQ